MIPRVHGTAPNTGAEHHHMYMCARVSGKATQSALLPNDHCIAGTLHCHLSTLHCPPPTMLADTKHSHHTLPVNSTRHVPTHHTSASRHQTSHIRYPPTHHSQASCHVWPSGAHLLPDCTAPRCRTLQQPSTSSATSRAAQPLPPAPPPKVSTPPPWLAEKLPYYRPWCSNPTTTAQLQPTTHTHTHICHVCCRSAIHAAPHHPRNFTPGLHAWPGPTGPKGSACNITSHLGNLLRARCHHDSSPLLTGGWLALQLAGLEAPRPHHWLGSVSSWPSSFKSPSTPVATQSSA